MPNIKSILMNRDNMSSEQADELIADAQDAFNECLEAGDQEAAYNICEEYFGLEPDYLHELM